MSHHLTRKPPICYHISLGVLFCSEAESGIELDPRLSINHELFTSEAAQFDSSATSQQPQSPSQSPPETPNPKSPYTYTQRKKRALEDAVMAIADSCKRQHAHDDTSPMLEVMSKLTTNK